jgi:hypothetical protein
MNIFNRNIKLNDFPISNIPKIKKSITEEDLEEGELICSKCNGVGFLNKIESENTSIYKDTCPKCQGSGKLDWIENVMGKKPIITHGTSTSGSGMLNTYGAWGTSGYVDYSKEIISMMAAEMAKKIDDEILEMIKKGG